MFEKTEDGRVLNTAVVINPDGDIVARYSKMFPFRPYEQGISAGTEFCVFDVPEVGRFGLSICYDIWFPETTRQLTSQGVEVLIHPVLTGTTDRDAEIAIARATAAQFQCYVFDVNGLAAGGVGRSLVVDPTATVLHQSAGQEDIFPIEIDLDVVRRQRRNRHAGPRTGAERVSATGRWISRFMTGVSDRTGIFIPWDPWKRRRWDPGPA